MKCPMGTPRAGKIENGLACVALGMVQVHAGLASNQVGSLARPACTSQLAIGQIGIGKRS